MFAIHFLAVATALIVAGADELLMQPNEVIGEFRHEMGTHTAEGFPNYVSKSEWKLTQPKELAAKFDGFREIDTQDIDRVSSDRR